MKALRDSTVAILGLGLMGGSLAQALAARPRTVARVVGMDRDLATVQAALAGAAIAHGETKVGDWLCDADIIVLATPVRVILAQLEELGERVRPGTLVLDLGSTKSEITRAMARLPQGVFPVGGHPMCGKETSGWTCAEPTLYVGKLFILTPTGRTTDAALELAAALARAAGARPVRMEADRHDRIVAAVSHLPYLVAANLVGAVAEWGEEEPELWNVAASGFADTTRLAASQIDMMMDILVTNRGPIVERLREHARREATLADLLASGDDAALRDHLARIGARRREWKGTASNG